MPEPHTLIVFAGVSLALLVVPGPAVIYVITRSVTQGRAAGLVSTLGIETGNLTHAAFATVGLSALLASSASAFSVIKYTGAAYLVYLSVRAMFGDAAREELRPQGTSRSRLYWQGLAVAVLNPKTALFFLAFLPQFVDPSLGPAWAQVAILGALFVALATLSDGAYALVAGGAGDWLRSSARRRAWLHRASGAIYLGLGASAALSGTRAEGYPAR
jgi:threonine/homoserine/homoserine lactone efflux protein